ncbi:hypothetical protein AAMO2058_000364500 [Amorphochlora amoebiformis]
MRTEHTRESHVSDLISRASHDPARQIATLSIGSTTYVSIPMQSNSHDDPSAMGRTVLKVHCVLSEERVEWKTANETRLGIWESSVS